MAYLFYRTFFSFLAHSLFFGLHLAYILITIPLVIYCWGSEKLSGWLLIQAFAYLFQLADVGLSTAIPNFVHQCGIKNEQQLAAHAILCSFYSIIVTYLIFTVIMCICLFMVAPYMALDSIFKKECYIPSILILGLCNALNAFGHILVGVFRVYQHNAKGVIWNAGQKFAALLSIVIFIPLCEDPILVAIMTFIFQVSVLTLMVYYMLLKYGNIWISKQKPKLHDFMSVLNLGFDYLPLQIGNLLYFNGLTIVVGETLGVASVATFNASRTIARLIAQLFETLRYGLYPELTHLFAKNEFKKLFTLLRVFICATLLLSLLMLIILALCGEIIFKFWTQNKVDFNIEAFVVMLLAVLIGNVSSVLIGLFQSINQLEKFAWVFLVSNVLLIFSTHYFCVIFNHIAIPSLAMLLFEFIIFILIIRHLLCKFKK